MKARLRRWLASLCEALRIVAFLALVATVWAVTAYVCGRQAMLITEEGARMLVRQVLPGVF